MQTNNAIFINSLISTVCLRKKKRKKEKKMRSEKYIKELCLTACIVGVQQLIDKHENYRMFSRKFQNINNISFSNKMFNIRKSK